MSGTSYAELRAQAVLLGLKATGTKSALESRIRRHLAGTDERAAKITDAEMVVTSWNGLPNYHCTRCHYASTKKRLTVIHIAEVHTHDD